MIIDFHVDTYLKLSQLGLSFQEGSPHLQVDSKKLKGSGVEALFFSLSANPAFTGEAALEHVLEQARTFEQTLGPLEVRTFLSVEGGTVLNEDPSSVAKLAQHKIRKLTLSHFTSPSWAGADKETGKGISLLGEKILATMNEHEMLIDVAHCSEQTMLDAAGLSTRPIVYSHGGVGAINPIPRNISDRAIRAICNTGGVIGISFFPLHLTSQELIAQKDQDIFWKDLEVRTRSLTAELRLKTETEQMLLHFPRPSVLPGIDLVFQHIDHIVRNFGDDFVAIGSDFDGTPFSCLGLEDVSKLNSLKTYLGNAGYSHSRIEKIMGGNILRVIKP